MERWGLETHGEGGCARQRRGRSENSKRKKSFKRRKTNGFNFKKTENV
jgi:hypothetical protein